MEWLCTLECTNKETEELEDLDVNKYFVCSMGSICVHEQTIKFYNDNTSPQIKTHLILDLRSAGGGAVI